MALIMVSGLPCSGRSTRVAELVADLERRIQGASTTASSSAAGSSSSSSATPSSSAHGIRRIAVVSDASVHNSKECYATQRSEKPARASYLSAVTRALSKDCIVIADGGAGLNIKGFRYQLWCDAREAGVRCVSLQVHAPPETCRRWNAERRARAGAAAESSYEEATIEEMLMRYEEPNEMVRWDQPLFVASSVPVAAPGIEGAEAAVEPLPLEEIWQAAAVGRAQKAPGVVQPVRAYMRSCISC